MSVERKLIQLTEKKHCFNIICDECPLVKRCRETDWEHLNTMTVGAKLSEELVNLAKIKLEEYLFKKAAEELLEK